MSPTSADLATLCSQAAATHGDRPLFGTRGQAGWAWVSYADFGSLVDRARAGLHRLGLQPGEAVAIASDNSVEWAAMAYAAAGLGAPFVPLYPAQDLADWEWVLRDSQAVLGFAASADLAARLLGLELPDLRTVVCPEPVEGCRTWAELTAPAEPHPASAPDPSAPAAYIYTSGTTGEPKGVVLTHGNLCSQVDGLQAAIPLVDQTSLSFLPWAHSFGQTAELHAMVSMGNAIAINDRIPNLMRNLQEVRPTLLIGVPRIYHRIHEEVRAQVRQAPGPIAAFLRTGLAAADKQVAGERLESCERVALWWAGRRLFPAIKARLGGRLRTAISGSARLSPEVARLLVALGIEVYEGYGLTECSPIATLNRPGAVRLGSVGKPLPGVQIELDHRLTGEEGGEGEVLVRGPNVMQGYRGQPDASARILTEDGTLRTGDLGRIDADGFLWITGRLTEQFKLENGRFVVPGPIEVALSASPYIAHSLVFGANRVHPVALIVPDAEALRAWAIQQGLERVDLESNHRVRDLLSAELTRLTEPFKPWERPADFAICTREFTPENGLLTPTHKVRRARVLTRFQPLIEALYSRSDAAPAAGNQAPPPAP